MTSGRRLAYEALASELGRIEGLDRDVLGRFTDVAWRHLAPTGVSWLGFYRIDETDSSSLLLGACRDRPACSPIGLHGVCGQALTSGRSRIVEDVATLGEAYVACDPRDRSEIVIPLRISGGGPHAADAVLDLDSFEVGSFSDEDDRALRTCLRLVGLDPIEDGEAR